MRRKMRCSSLAIGLVLLAVTTCTSAGTVDKGTPPPAASPRQTLPPLQTPPNARPDAPVSSTPPGGGVRSPPVEPSYPPITAPPGSQLVEAPIDGLEVVVRESFPVQYGLQIRAGLPNGCAKRAGYEVSRNGTQIEVRVLNAMPLGQVACTMIYGTYELNVSLGSDFSPGTTYTVQVNDKTTSFVAR